MPVGTEIKPTTGVLRAALKALLILEGQAYYNGLGLYNALYLSNLTIGSLSYKWRVQNYIDKLSLADAIIKKWTYSG